MPSVANAKANRMFYLACLGLVLLIWDAYLIHVQLPVFPFDDAYIILHSAQTVLLGRDPNYIGTPALSGVTSVIHVALVSLLLTFLPPLWALDTSQWLAVLTYVLGLARLSFAQGANRLQAALIVLAGVALGRTPHQLFNGMETGLTLAALTWALVFASDPKISAQPVDSSFLCAAAVYPAGTGAGYSSSSGTPRLASQARRAERSQ